MLHHIEFDDLYKKFNELRSEQETAKLRIIQLQTELNQLKKDILVLKKNQSHLSGSMY